MSLTLPYILSQVFTISMYITLACSYYSKDRRKILILNFAGLVLIGIAYIFLHAWSGLAMSILGIIRNIIFMLDEKKNGKRDTINKKDIIILIILVAITIALSIFTYSGFLSLFSVFATMLYTISVWQKKTIIYKILGIPTGICWIIYNVYIFSIIGMILESILLICAITGFLLELAQSRKENKAEKNR